MPMIDVYAAEALFSDRHALAQDLAGAVMRWEHVSAVFAAGDVRRSSMKRVAAAVGEGASAVRSVHIAIGVCARWAGLPIPFPS